MALADTCEWKDKDEQIIFALIFGANHRDAQRKALSKPKDIKLKDVIDHFAAFEATDAYHKLLSANNSSDTTDVNRIKKTNNKIKSSSSTNFINCYSCGSNHKYGDCPAYGHICKTCGRRNHLESMCRSKNDKPNPIQNINNQNHRNPIIVDMDVNLTRLMPIPLMARMNMTHIAMCIR